VGESGAVHCTELDEENVRLAQGFLTRAGLWGRVTYHREEATAALNRVGGTWDIVYNDIDKDGYPATVDLAHAHLRPGGLFITDNVLWSGRVLDGEDDGSAATRGVKEFTRRLLAHPGPRPSTPRAMAWRWRSARGRQARPTSTVVPSMAGVTAKAGRLSTAASTSALERGVVARGAVVEQHQPPHVRQRRIDGAPGWCWPRRPASRTPACRARRG
jgi:hypothetical protein